MIRLNKSVAECLRASPEQRFTARQIADWMRTTYPAETQQKLERSTALQGEADLVQQLVREIAANRPQITRAYPNIRTTEGRPRLYYWTERSEEQEVSQPILAPESADTPILELREAALYPMLAEFLSSDSGLFVQRIDEKRSSNRRGPQGNRWLYPDLVALEDLTAGWSAEVRQCVSEAGAKKARLWSFEVKLLLNRSNVREAYFQAVSNSSWANFPYLVSAEIEGAETMRELRMLNALHGVGLIRVDPEEPTESEVLIPARERPEIDWANCDRLASENADFAAVVRRLWEFYRTGSVKAAEWKA